MNDQTSYCTKCHAFVKVTREEPRQHYVINMWIGTKMSQVYGPLTKQEAYNFIAIDKREGWQVVRALR